MDTFFIYFSKTEIELEFILVLSHTILKGISMVWGSTRINSNSISEIKNVFTLSRIVIQTFTIDADYKVGIHVWWCHVMLMSRQYYKKLGMCTSAEEFQISFFYILITVPISLPAFRPFSFLFFSVLVLLPI